MTYTTDSHIDTVEQVKEFFRFLMVEKHININPNDEFDGMAEMSVLEVSLYGRLMNECFAVCQDAGEDIYALGYAEMKGIEQ